MKKQKTTMRKTKAAIKGTIEFETIYDVIRLENGLSNLLKGHKLSEDEHKQVRRFMSLVESLTGNSFLTYFLEERDK